LAQTVPVAAPFVSRKYLKSNNKLSGTGGPLIAKG
jgi:hypothetical protein